MKVTKMTPEYKIATPDDVARAEAAQRHTLTTSAGDALSAADQEALRQMATASTAAARIIKTYDDAPLDV